MLLCDFAGSQCSNTTKTLFCSRLQTVVEFGIVVFRFGESAPQCVHALCVHLEVLLVLRVDRVNLPLRRRLREQRTQEKLNKSVHRVEVVWYLFLDMMSTHSTGVGSGGGGGGAIVCVCPPPPLLNPHFYFPLELFVYITLTNNYLTFFIYQLIILWTISIN